MTAACSTDQVAPVGVTGGTPEAVFYGALAAWAFVVDHHKPMWSSNDKMPREIYGTCQFQGKAPADPKPCTDTYVLFTDERQHHETRVWVDEHGHFNFPIQKGQKFTLQAILAEHVLQSEPFKVTRPGEVTLTISLNK